MCKEFFVDIYIHFIVVCSVPDQMDKIFKIKENNVCICVGSILLYDIFVTVFCYKCFIMFPLRFTMFGQCFTAFGNYFTMLNNISHSFYCVLLHLLYFLCFAVFYYVLLCFIVV